MTEFLALSVDKFIFKVATDRTYSSEGLWIQVDGKHLRMGVSDFLQQRSGDVAFAEIKPAGTVLAIGAEVGTIETIKVNISLTSPIQGKIVEVNPMLETTPEAINQDPYNTGWLAILEPADWETDRTTLLDPQVYFTLIKGLAEDEAKKI